MTPLNVYMVMVSFGASGAERRFANIWTALRNRGRVRPILVLPQSLSTELATANLLPDTCADGIWPVREPDFSGVLPARRLLISSGAQSPLIGAVRTRLFARAIKPLLERISQDPFAVVHFGLPSGPVVAPPLPTVFECVDATLAQLSHRHYERAAGTPAIIHCQTSRIASRLESTWRHVRPSWLIRVNPCCFARYPAKIESERARTIVFCGRFDPEKSPLLLLEAVGELAARGIEFRTEMLGSGPLEREMIQFVAKHGLGHRVFIGHSKDPSTKLAHASIFVSVQQSDNYPSQSLLEAMGSGCAVVASDVGETSRLVDERVGIRVPLDRGALADALQQLLANPSRTGELGRHARDRVREHFSEERYVAFLEDLYFEARERWMTRERPRRKAESESGRWLPRGHADEPSRR